MTDVGDPAEAYERLRSEMSRVLIGNESVVERLLISLLTDGHVLLEGVPGVAKTTLAELFARATGLDHGRIQLTPDSLPADITGTTVYREATGEFEVKKGPIFANVVVADEINRATPKTQSALLEAMQERQVTINGEVHPLPDPFMVVATQNPIEMEGTFELPEAQRDRFQFKLTVDIPSRADEHDLLDRFDERPGLGPDGVEQVIPSDRLPSLQERVVDVHVERAVKSYLLDIVTATREHPTVDHGASPRAAIAFQNAVKGRAAIHGRSYVTPDDVKALARPVLAHRIVLGPDAAFGDVTPASVVEEVVSSVEPPSAETPAAVPDDESDEGIDAGNTAADGGYE